MAELSAVEGIPTHPQGVALAVSQGRDASAQVLWAARPLAERVTILRRFRHELARRTTEMAQAVSPRLARTPADTGVAEMLPLLAACQFLEQRAKDVLAVHRLGRRGLPLWLTGVSSEVHRVPLGHVLVVGPSNYPLFLPGVQTLQALAAGNAVTWKPGPGGREVADLFAEIMMVAGLPAGLLHVTEDSVAAVSRALADRPDKVFFTGSAETGRVLMRQLAETLTPSVMELSGCDAVIVLPSADLSRVIAALTFGMRFNGSATCMAPRRVLLVDGTTSRHADFVTSLRVALSGVDSVAVPDGVREHLHKLLMEALQGGAHIQDAEQGPQGEIAMRSMCPLVVTEVRPEMRLAQADVFAPVLSVIRVAGDEGVLAAHEACPFALTASIFGEEGEARRLAAKLTAGSILINDIIVPTADPRLPFGGRRQSGFGVTRGAEGLLEMTAIKTLAVRRGRSTRHYETTGKTHEEMFDGLIAASYAGRWTERWSGLRQLAAAGRKLAKKQQGAAS